MDAMSTPLPTADARVCADPCAGPCAGCPDRIVCRCLKITEEVIVGAIHGLGLRTVHEIRSATQAGTGCRCCQMEIRELIEVHVQAFSPSPSMCSAR
mgnify:CR=1 FL=1